MSRTFLIAGAAAAGALNVAACSAPAAVVEGWREPTSEELRNLAAERNAQSPDQPPPITSVGGDFNGDGKRDRVALLIDEGGHRFAPYMFDGAGAPPLRLDRGDARGRMYRYSLGALPANLMYASCVESAADPRECEKDKGVRGKILFFYEVNRGGQMFVWDETGVRERPVPENL